jgi:hypothetical protein
MKKRRNLLWGIIAVTAAGILLLRTLELIPDGLYDLILRALPVLLVLFGLTLLLRNRAPLSNLAALGLSAALVFGIGMYAFSSRVTQQRDENVQPFTQSIEAAVTLLVVHLDVLTTDVEIRIAQVANTVVTGQFVGSLESLIGVEYQSPTQGQAVFNVREIRPNSFPMLEAVGRGKLNLQLPPDIAVALVVNSQHGRATLDLTQVNLERLTLNLQQGDAVVTLPEYMPRSPNAQDQPGSLNILNGDIVVLVPDSVGARFELVRRGNGLVPKYDPTVYNFLVGDVLENRRIDDLDITARYVIEIPRGQVTVETMP